MTTIKMTSNFKTCPKCGKEFGSRGMANHLRACQKPPVEDGPVLKGQSTTGVVHYAKETAHVDPSISQPVLSPKCGMRPGQRAYLSAVPTDREVTCKKCQPPATTISEEPVTTPEPELKPAPAKVKKPKKPATTTAKPAVKLPNEKNPLYARIMDLSPEDREKAEPLVLELSQKGYTFTRAWREVLGDISPKEVNRRKKEASPRRASANLPTDQGERRTLADKAKELRDSGMSWWKIAFELNLPGSARTLREGKRGAPLARKLYAEFHGSTRTARKVESNGAVRKSRSTRREERKVSAQEGRSPLFSDSLEDREILESVTGRTIQWQINMDNIDGKGAHYTDQEAVVHPKGVRVYRNGLGVRHLSFQEGETAKGGFLAGAYRTIRVDTIHTVR